MSALRGVLAGTLGLSLLQATVSNAQSASRAGSLFTLAASIAKRLIDPTVPLIPDLRKN